jgi:glucose-6-phosphate-specific signal transduction histidine kinase
LNCGPGTEQLPENDKVIIYQVIKRLLDGIVRLGHAEHIKISVNVRGAIIEVVIVDNGVEFGLMQAFISGQAKKKYFLPQAADAVCLLGGDAWTEKSQGISTTYITVPLHNQYNPSALS